MPLIKSSVSFFRKELREKGKSMHTGRGSYIMGFDCSVEDMEERIERMIDRNADKFNVIRAHGQIVVELKSELVSNENYRTLVFSPHSFAKLAVDM